MPRVAAGLIGSSLARLRRVPRPVFVVGLVAFVDTMLYAVLTPMLPGLASHLRLSKLSAGVLSGAYAAGALLGSLPGGLLAARAGPRAAVCTGLALLAASLLAFGLLDQIVALDVARFIEGLGGACSWAGGIAWIVSETPSRQRGAMIGNAIGAAVGGAVLGPAVGTLASAIGRPVAFACFAAAAALLAIWTSRLPQRHTPSQQGTAHLLAALRRPFIALTAWLVALPAIASGTVSLLAPLRLRALGASAIAIGGAFLAAALLEAIVIPLVGAMSDRRGRMLPLRVGLAAAAGTLLCFTLPGSVALLIVVLISIYLGLACFWGPANALLADAAVVLRLDDALGAALMNGAWAGGVLIGAAGGGALARAAGDGLPMALAAGLCLATLGAIALVPALRQPPAIVASEPPPEPLEA